MSHHAALVSLQNTVKLINYLSGGLSLFLLDRLYEVEFKGTQVSNHPSFTLIDVLYKEVVSLRDFLNSRPRVNENIYELMGVASSKRSQREFYYGRDWNSLDEELRQVICRMEDVLESQISARLLLHGTNHFCIDMTNVEQEIRIFSAMVTMIKEKCNLVWLQQVDSSSSSSSGTCFSAEDLLELVGTQVELDELKHHLFSNKRDKHEIAIVGMAGMGKTALAKAVIQDPEVRNHFHYHLFVHVGQNYRLEEVLLCIFSQLDDNNNNNNNNNNKMKLNYNEKTLIREHVLQILNDKRYIIVLDDVWDENICSSFTELLPNNNNGSRVLLTTRLHTVAGVVPHNHEKQFLDKEESWNLLRKKVFGTNSCPYELKKSGKKIAEKCEGLPLAIISVGKHLAKAAKTVEYWESLAEKGIANIIIADEEVFKVLHPSYKHLPLYLKAHFLYLGVYPEYCEILASKLVKLWIAEGFIGLGETIPELHVSICLKEIKDHNIIVIKQQRLEAGHMRVKACSLHIVYWCYCKTQAGKEKLFQILNTIDDCSVEGTKGQQRLCIHNNCLFGLKDFHSSMESVSNVRSMLCTGPYHNYPVSVTLGLKLLRVLDAVAIRFYEFPYEVLKLVLLRYLTFTYDGSLPASISQLISLQFLIVRRHVRVIDPRCPSYLPIDIWDMKELRHLQVEGSDLPEPPHHGAELPKLLKLLDVTPRCCSPRILEKIPNLTKLGVQIVLPEDATEPLCSLDHIKELRSLRSLKCVIVNPRPSSQVAVRAYPTTIFPSDLQRLALSGFGYSWEQMGDISRLPMLEKLKLRHCAFQGSTWEVKNDEFYNLRFLLLEDLDLRYWVTYPHSFMMLGHLIIKHCYKLVGIPKRHSILKAIEIVDCKPYVVDCAKSADIHSPHVSKATIVSSWQD